MNKQTNIAALEARIDMKPNPQREAKRYAADTTPKKTAKKHYSLGDFQRAGKEADKVVTDAYLSAHSLKAMWDTFEEIPPKQRDLYDANMKVISLLGKARDESYQNYMSLKKYRLARYVNAARVDGKVVHKGDWIGFKADVEQEAEIVEIRGNEITVKAPSEGFEGGYIRRQDFYTVSARDAWLV